MTSRRRYLEFQNQLHIIEVDTGVFVVEIRLEGKDILTFLLDLFLLQFDLSEKLLARDVRSKTEISLRKLESERGTGALDGPSATLALSINEIDVLCAFLLSYYRDGFAPVDHVDVELDLERRTSAVTSLSLLVNVDRSAAPMSPEEARRLLAEDD